MSVAFDKHVKRFRREVLDGKLYEIQAGIATGRYQGDKLAAAQFVTEEERRSPVVFINIRSRTLYDKIAAKIPHGIKQFWRDQSFVTVFVWIVGGLITVMCGGILLHGSNEKESSQNPPVQQALSVSVENKTDISKLKKPAWPLAPGLPNSEDWFVQLTQFHGEGIKIVSAPDPVSLRKKQSLWSYSARRAGLSMRLRFRQVLCLITKLLSKIGSRQMR